jgi:signal transduction histidine kinase
MVTALISLHATMIRHEHNPQTTLSSDSKNLVRMIGDFAEIAGRAKDLSQLGHSIVSTLSGQYGLIQATIWVKETDAGQYRHLTSIGQNSTVTIPTTLPNDHPLIRRLAGLSHILQYQEERESSVQAALATMHAAICIPLRSYKGLLGLCILGPRNTNMQVSGADIAVTQTIAHIACNALDHHMAQDDLRRSSTLMRRTDRLRSLEIMAGGFAHEIRNPLTSIKTFIQLAPQRQHDPVFIKDFSRLAIEDVHRIERLLHEILDYASYMTPHPSDVDLNELVTSCLGFVSATASHRGIRIRTVLAPDIPLLALDRQQIKQVLLNLLMNALDAMPNGQGVICVQTRLLPVVDGATWVQLQVEDEGCGIAPEHLEQIFDPFFTTKHSNSASDGSGLGLTTAHQIVHDHGGRLLVESQVGRGSKFSVNLPATDMHTIVPAARE